ncbi:mthl1 [Drosophila busckii]|uniref:Mthl1 n=1 Tax=Drosophila busckii TaxID=30019 RepID=A0A0M4F9I2_DROBS|nr:probable G-protein coupled receptor Mth-like 1 [Drosophila busckii]ALC48882.1 mthl1 [Drosophila busckii]
MNKVKLSIVLLLLLLLIQLTVGQEKEQEQVEDNSTAIATTAGTTSAAPPSGRPSPPRVVINKCCQLGEYLNSSTLSCIAGTTELWVPAVYLVQQQRFFEPHGGKPRFMKFAPNVRPRCKWGNEPELFSSRQFNVMLVPNGTFMLRERGLRLQPQDYCVDRDVALVCLNNDALQPPNVAAAANAPPMLRLRKCCGMLFNYDSSLKSCNHRKQLPANGTQLQLAPQLAAESYQTSFGFPDCPVNDGGYAIAGDWQEAKLNQSTGALQLPHTQLAPAAYCLEHTERAGEVKIIVCAQHFTADQGQGEQSEVGNVQRAMLDVSFIISIVFLAATLVAGYMLPAVHHALHWRCQIYYVFCLLLGKILLVMVELNTALVPGTHSCLLVATGMHFFFLSAFFWLNTMCFNIWWTFRDFRPSSLERNQETLRLRLYSAYAWGVPLLICAIAACVDQLPEAETSLLRPGFGQSYCWFDNRSLAIFAYFFGPIGLLLCINIVLFISTTHQLTCGLWKRDDVKSTSEKSALGRVCLKLVVVMGATWICDIISWLVGGPQEYWLVTDLINALQGVFIFIVVGCQPQVWTACKRICCPRLRHDITNTTNGVHHSSSSQGLPSMAGCGTEFTQNTSMNVSSLSPASLESPAPNNNATPTTTTTAAATPTSVAATAKIPMETIC